MIRLPKEIAQMIKTIEDEGFEAYAVGGCVRDSILGRTPEDWDLTSNASRDTLEALFPHATIVNKKLGVMRITEGEVTADIAAFRIDGEYKDYRHPETVMFTNEIGEDLRRRDFTMNAIAVSPRRGEVDPFHGRADIVKKLIRGIGDPRLRFEEDALRILRAIRFASQLGFEIDDETLQAMKEKSHLLKHISVERIREEFVKTITAQNSGAGLGLLIKTGVLLYVLGEGCMINVMKAEMKKLSLLSENIDQSKNQLNLRLALVYLCFEKDNALHAIEMLSYSNEMKRLLQNAVSLTGELDEIRDMLQLKRFISRIGTADFQYLSDVSEQQRKVYHLDVGALHYRMQLYNEIQSNGEPIFIEDLAVNGNDLIEAGLAEGVGIGKLLYLLLDVVHQAPEKNEKDLLLKMLKGIECRVK